MVVAARKPAPGPKGKKKAQTFIIDCTKPVDDKIMELASFEKFLQERIKVDGKAGEPGPSVSSWRCAAALAHGVGLAAAASAAAGQLNSFTCLDGLPSTWHTWHMLC